MILNFVAYMTSIVFIVFGIYLLITKEFVFRGGIPATETEVLVIGWFNILFGGFILFYQIFNKKEQNDNKNK